MPPPAAHVPPSGAVTAATRGSAIAFLARPLLMAVRAGLAAWLVAARAAGRGAGAAAIAALMAGAVPAASSHAAEAPPLGRLFNTPQQRMQLDAQRDGTAQSALPADSMPVAPAPPPPQPPAPLVVNGVVRPAHGKATVWLNQEPLPDGQRVLRSDGKVTLILPSGQRVTLKPGQHYDEATGEVRDASQ